MRLIMVFLISVCLGSCSHSAEGQLQGTISNNSEEEFLDNVSNDSEEVLSDNVGSSNQNTEMDDQDLLSDLDIGADGANQPFDQGYADNFQGNSIGDQAGSQIPAPPELNKGRISWLGYQFSDQEKKLKIEIKFSGQPKYVLSQELNQKQQPELIISFLNTSIRKGLQKDLVAEEFIAPVGYVRSRSKKIANNVLVTDVALTLRAAEKPMLYADQNRIVLEYRLSENSAEYLSMLKNVGTAELISANITPEMIVGRTPIDDQNNIILPKTRPQSVDPQNLPAYSEESLYNSIPKNNNDAMIQRAIEQQPLINNSSNQYNIINNVDVQQVNNSIENTQNNNELNRVLDINAIEEISEPVAINTPEQVVNNQGNANQMQFDSQGQDADLDLFENQVENQNVNGNNFNSSLPPINTGSLPAPVVPAQVAPPVQPIYNQAPVANPVELNNSLDTNEPDFENNQGDFEVEDEDLDFEEEMFEVRNTIGWLHVAQANSYDVDNALVNSVNSTEFQNSNQGAMAMDSDMVGNDSAMMDQQYDQKMMDLDFRGAPLIEVVRAISNESNVNFTFPPGIGNTAIFVDFKNVSWDLALKAVLESSGLGMVEIAPNLVRIDRIAALATQAQQLEDAKKTAQRLLPKKVLVFRLSYSESETMKTTLTDMLGGIESNLKIVVDKRTNSLIVEGPPKDLEKVKVLVQRLDLQTPQVEISSRIVEVNSVNGDSFGIKWGGMFNLDPSNGLGFGGLTFPNYARSNFAIDPGVDTSVGGIGLKLGSLNPNIDLDALLGFAERRQKTKVLQKNRIVVQDNETGSISGGTTDYFIPAASGDAPAEAISVSYQLSINVTPRISADGGVQMKLDISSVVPTDTAAGQTGSTDRSVSTSLLKQSGETAVIGGLWDSTSQDVKTGVPILSWLPIIGPLFRFSSTSTNQKELLILITPRVLNSSAASGGNKFRANSGGDNNAIGADIGSLNAVEPANANEYFNNANTSNNFNSNTANFNNSGNSQNYVNYENSNQQENFNNSNSNTADFNNENSNLATNVNNNMNNANFSNNADNFNNNSQNFNANNSNDAEFVNENVGNNNFSNDAELVNENVGNNNFSNNANNNLSNNVSNFEEDESNEDF